MSKKRGGQLAGVGLTSAVLVPVVIGAIAIALYRAHFPGDLVSNQSEWGVFGDFFGGLLNPIVGIVTLVLLVKTLLSQQRAIELQSDELALQRQELKSQREETARSTAALDAQHQAIVRQSFEQSLFTWLGSYRELIRELQSNMSDFQERQGRSLLNAMAHRLSYEGLQGKTNSYVWRRFDEEAWETIVARAKLGRRRDQIAVCRLIDILLDEYSELESKHESDLGSLYRTLYRMLSWIDDSPLSNEDKWHYVALVRAQLSTSELVLLLLNGIYYDGMNLGFLCEKYAIFDNLNTNWDPILYSLRHLPLQVGWHPIMEKFGDWPYSEAAFDSSVAKIALEIRGADAIESIS